MEPPEEFLSAIESGWLRISENISEEYLDPLLALWVAQHIRAVAALSYSMGAYQSQGPRR